jgi:hypothetical protein
MDDKEDLDAFEMAANRALGDRIRADKQIARDMWCALANVTWKHQDGYTALFTFRGAGGLVADIRGEGDYMDWYCCSGPYPRVTEEIRQAMAAEGWTPHPE